MISGMHGGNLGDYETQIELLTRALEIEESYYERDYADLAITLNNLANACGMLGDYEKQEYFRTRAMYYGTSNHYYTYHLYSGNQINQIKD